jgi:FAD synthetase
MKSVQNNFKDGLQDVVKRTNIKAVMMGTRSTDPYAEKLEKITMTTKDYPPLLRINPILYWTYEEVWIFLRNY